MEQLRGVNGCTIVACYLVQLAYQHLFAVRYRFISCLKILFFFFLNLSSRGSGIFMLCRVLKAVILSELHFLLEEC